MPRHMHAAAKVNCTRVPNPVPRGAAGVEIISNGSGSHHQLRKLNQAGAGAGSTAQGLCVAPSLATAGRSPAARAQHAPRTAAVQTWFVQCLYRVSRVSLEPFCVNLE